MAKVDIDTPTIARPPIAPLRRDDQTLLWVLAGPGLSWPATIPDPIRFLPAGGMSPGGVPYSEWPPFGTSPQPIGAKPPVGPDRRPYWASANHPIPGDQAEWYHYEFAVAETDAVTGEELVLWVRAVQHDDGTFHDPDVVNQPQP